MARRHDSIGRLFITLLAALACGLLLEAEGLHIWAKRLPVGPLREMALPVTEAWFGLVAPAAQPRTLALDLKRETGAVLEARQQPAVADAVATAAAIDYPKVFADPIQQAKPPAAPEKGAAPASEERPPEQAGVGESASVAPGAPAPRPKPPPAAATGKTQVVLFGDSMMAVGLAPTISRWLSRQSDATVIKAYKSGTGLVRPEVFDWMAEYPQRLGNARPSYIVCAIGANDAQGVQVGNRTLAFGTADWDEFYTRRLTDILDIVTRDGVPVLWLGMPEMRSPVFSKKMTHLNSLAKRIVARYPSVTWLDSNGSLGGPQGAFQQYRADEKGRLIKMRADDGIHLTDEGALFLMTAIADWVNGQASRQGERGLSGT